jgi:hypothetical protein
MRLIIWFCSTFGFVSNIGRLTFLVHILGYGGANFMTASRGN